MQCWRSFVTAHGAVLGVVLVAVPLVSTREGWAASEALDWGFRFASAIQSDAKDRGRAQEAVVLELIQRGDRDGALALADRVEGWHRGVVYAELATALAQAGREQEARRLVSRAEETRQTVSGWESQRLAFHVAGARAALGEIERAQEITSRLVENDDRQYAGRAAAVLAQGHAARGAFDEALRSLEAVEGNDDYEVAWWRTSGYLALARRAGLTREQQVRALAAARASAARIDGWKREQALEEVAAEYERLGDAKHAAESLEAAESVVAELGEASPDRAPLSANLARAWAAIDRADRARPVLARAEPLVPRALVIDQPGLYANLGLGYRMAGDVAESRRLFDRAFSAAEGLVNARPRALAAVEICIALARCGQPLDTTDRARLAGLLHGLGEPW